MNGVSSLRVYAREKGALLHLEKTKAARRVTNGEVKMPPDVVACRVVLDPLDKKDDSALCYHVLDRVRKVWRSNENRTKDYIAHPKLNGYRSLHATAKTRLAWCCVRLRSANSHAGHASRCGVWFRSAFAVHRRVFGPDGAVLFTGQRDANIAIGRQSWKGFGGCFTSERVFVVAEGGGC